MIVTSPTYLLDNRYDYDENKTIHHMDLYRLPTGCDLTILDIPKIYETSICLIEWPQRMGNNLPNDFLDVDMKINPNESRTISFTSNNSRWTKILENLSEI